MKIKLHCNVEDSGTMEVEEVEYSQTGEKHLNFYTADGFVFSSDSASIELDLKSARKLYEFLGEWIKKEEG